MWKESPERAKLLQDIEHHNAAFPLNGPALESFVESRRAQQSQSLCVRAPCRV